MPTLETTCRDAILDAVDTLLGASATAVFETSADAEVATLALGSPAFGAASGGSMALSGTPLQDTDATGGTIAQCSFYTGGVTKQFECTCGTSGADINFPGGLAVNSGDTVELTSFSLGMPAS